MCLAPLSILDVGGLPQFWERAGFAQEPDVSLTYLNISRPKNAPTNFVVGDARAMPEFDDGQFDIVFSNSCVEHVGDFDDQRRMADEVRRIGRRYFVQTPNRYFPIEPHYLLPGVQFLPLAVRIWIAEHVHYGRGSRIRNHQVAVETISALRLLTGKEMLALFPDGKLYSERIGGITKSFVAYKF